MRFSHIWARSWQNKCGVPGYIFIRLKINEKKQNEYKIPKHLLWSIRTGKKRNLISPSMRSVALHGGRARSATIHCSTFVEQGPVGNSMAITTQYVFEQLHRGRNSEHVHPSVYQAQKHELTHMNLHRWTHTHTVHSLTRASNLCGVSWM